MAVLAVAMTAACTSGEQYAGDVTPAVVAVVSAPARMMPGAKPDTITVQVRGQAGEPVPGQRVMWLTAESHATVAVVDSVSDDNGLARALFTPGPRLGPQRISATVGTLPSAAVDVNVTSGAWKVVFRDCGVADNGQLACFPLINGARQASLVGSALYHSVAENQRGLYCASRIAGGVDCFTSSNLASPNIQSLDGAPPPLVALVADWNAFCGLTTAGRAWCWGDNRGGRLGTGDQINRAVPTLVTESLAFEQIVLSRDHGCGLVPGGEVYCWGSNTRSQLGLVADNVAARPPQRVDGLPPATGLAANAHGSTCALGVDRLVRCWGFDAFGFLGRAQPGGPVASDHVPEPIAGVGAARAVTGTYHGFAVIDVAGQTYFWGEGDGWGVYRPTQAMASSATGFATHGSPYQACVTQSGRQGVDCLDTNAAVWVFLDGIIEPGDNRRLFHGLPSPP